MDFRSIQYLKQLKESVMP